MCSQTVGDLNKSGNGGTEVTDSKDDLIDGDNPSASLSHDLKVQFTTAR